MLVISLKKLDKKTPGILKKIKGSFAIELRLDLIKIQDIKKFKKEIDCEIIFTLKKKFLENKRLDKRLDELFLLKPDYIDLEHDAPLHFFEKIKKETSIKIISSFHDYKKTPSLEKIFLKMQNPFADIYKIASFANSSLDSLTMLQFVQKKVKEGFKICGVCMGEKGDITRILAPLVGSFTYASINGPTAPGQLSYEILENRYRYSSLNIDSSIYALIGGDVSKSVSDIIHNKVLALSQKNGVYVKISLLKKELPLFFEKIKTLSFKGISVTMPFKEKVGRVLKEKKKPFPINTLVKKNKKWTGYNTDGIGALAALEKRILLKDKTIIILGAGGAAKAIALAVLKRKANVIILNRTRKRALFLARELNCRGGGLDDMEFYKKYDVLINATASEDPLEKKCFLPGSIAFDIHSRPQMTGFLKKALSKNCSLIYGFEMFIYQAKEQYRLWEKNN